MGGSSTPSTPLSFQSGAYGALGVPSATNVPTSRTNSVSWTDRSGNFWLFGGATGDLNGAPVSLNDLWEFNPTNNQWTWISGSSTANAIGIYGTQGMSSANNVPGARASSVSWTDNSGNLWLFGGQGLGSIFSPQAGYLNDLWEFNPMSKEWTWVSGSSSASFSSRDYQPPVYGTLGVASAGNFPGQRVDATGWVDKSGNFWLFSGFGYDPTGTEGFLNDLWEFNLTSKEWTWVSGSNTINLDGGVTAVFGTQGVAAATNVPGGRSGAVSWIDGTGMFWIFGGAGAADLNDLWQFNPAIKQWTWISGGNSFSLAQPVYGTLDIPSTANVPGGRDRAVGWTDTNGNLWLFGGNGNSATLSGYLNDLWKFNPVTQEWTWMSGSEYVSLTDLGEFGVYGTLGVPAAANKPVGRYGPVNWIDNSGNLWLFGGSLDSQNLNGYLNDLWRYQSQ